MRAQWVGDFSLFKANKPESEWESKPSLFGSTQNGNSNGPTSSLLSHVWFKDTFEHILSIHTDTDLGQYSNKVIFVCSVLFYISSFVNDICLL